MSLSLIAFQPAIELPSNMKPSVSMSSSITPEAMVRCCHLPLGSVKRRSTQSISSSLICERIPAAPPGTGVLSFTSASFVRSRTSAIVSILIGWESNRRSRSVVDRDSSKGVKSQEAGEDFTG